MPANIAWAFAKNPDLAKVLLAKYNDQDYWNNLDNLISSLRAAKCMGIQEKVSETGSSDQFQSTLSELEISLLLANKGKHVQLLSSSYFTEPGKKPPDLLVTDISGQAYIEVTRFNEDALVSIIVEDLRQFLQAQTTPYQVDVTIPDHLSMPVVDHASMQEKKEIALRVMAKFKAAFPSSGAPPSWNFSEEEITFSARKLRVGTGSPGFVNYGIIIVPDYLYLSRLRYLVTWKAEKRATWTGQDLKKPYIVAIDTEHIYLKEEILITAILGCRHTDHMEPLPQVREAADKGWGTLLEQEHLIPKDRIRFGTMGVFLSNPICKNVSGVIVRNDSNIWWKPNPFAAVEINDPHLLNYL